MNSNIQVLNKRAATHLNWCEDNWWLHETDDKIYGAVLDGCSTGINSHFASTFVKYALENAVKNVDEVTFLSHHPTTVDTVVTEVLDKIGASSVSLGLTDMNFLSTIVMFAYDKHGKDLYVKFFGDGTVFVNGEEHTHEEGNAPQYLAYQMYSSEVDYQTYLDTRKEMWFRNVDNFSVCSDGIHSFRNLKDSGLDKQVPVDFLVRNTDWAGQKKGLMKKFNCLTEKMKEAAISDELSWWEIQDDLTIIRYTT